MNVLSLFDGMSCGQIALNRLGIKYDKYFASEVDKFAMDVTMHNYPDTIQLGDVTQVFAKDLPQIDLLIGGSPCQGFSFAGKQLNFKDPRSKLFFEFVRLLRECKPKYFLLENVKMKREYEYAITKLLGVSCARINSNLVSAQNRRRLYWTNIPGDGDYVIGSFIEQPEDKGILLRDILEGNLFEEPVVLTEVRSDEGKQLRREAQAKGFDHTPFRAKIQVPREDGKANCLTTSPLGNKLIDKALWKDDIYFPYKADVPSNLDGKAKCLRASAGGRTKGCGVYNEDHTKYRVMTPEECEALQTVPRGYTSVASDSQRYRMLGNGWTIDVITHIMKGMGL